MASKKQQIVEQAARYAEVDAAAFAAMRELFGVSETYLRRVLRESGQALAPEVEGVRQETFAELERTLRRLEKKDRALVLTAKEHAKLAMRSARTDRRVKGEMLRWMDVWLSDPELFPAWVELRKRTEEFWAVMVRTESIRP